jgi:hypothetical protein
VCFYVCVCVCVCFCVCLCVRLCVCILMVACSFLCVLLCVFLCVCVCVCIFMCACVFFVCLFMCVYVFVSCVRACVYTSRNGKNGNTRIFVLPDMTSHVKSERRGGSLPPPQLNNKGNRTGSAAAVCLPLIHFTAVIALWQH